VILQSPPIGLQLPDQDEALQTGREFLETVGADTPDELRAVPWERLIGATIEMLMRGLRFGYWPVPFLPVRDGVHLRNEPLGLLDDARDDLDVLLGWTREEAAFAFALNPMYGETTREQVQTRLADTFGDRAPDAYAAYAAARPGAAPLDVLMDVISDELFRIPAVRLAESRAAAERPVWLYEFAYQSPAYGGRLGAAHCLDLPFTFANRDSWSHAPLAADIPPAADGLATAMHQAWISFARTGDPNHPGLPAWDRYRDSRTTMRFDTVTAPVNDPAAHWRRLHP
jgi:para-nitrobenzyl esterase